MINSEGAEMGKLVLSAIIGALIAGVAVTGIVFFWWHPFRVGEITIAMPNGPSMTFKVANSNEISELIRAGLENEKSANALIHALLSIIEQPPPGSMLGEKLVELAELRKPPFSSDSVPVKLMYGSDVPLSEVAVCENSHFLAKNIVVFVLDDDNQLLDNFRAYANVTLTFPCLAGGEIMRINNPDVEEFTRYTVLAKRDL